MTSWLRYIQKLDDAIKAVGAAEGVIYIFDMARTPIPYVNEAQSINLTQQGKSKSGHQIRVRPIELQLISYKYHARMRY